MLTFGIILVTSIGCRLQTPEEQFQDLKKRPASKAFTTLLNLEQYVLFKFREQKIEELARTLGDYDLYKEIYAYTDAGKLANPVPADEFYQNSFNDKRIKALLAQFNIFQADKYRLISIGEPKATVDFGPYKLHKFVPLVFEKADNDGESKRVVNDKIFAEILEKKRRFYWLNVGQ